jgi:hypothetical protein
MVPLTSLFPFAFRKRYAFFSLDIAIGGRGNLKMTREKREKKQKPASWGEKFTLSCKDAALLCFNLASANLV